MSSFDLNEEYQAYLERVGLNESTMPEDQIRETKRAFFGGCAQFFLLFNEIHYHQMPDSQRININYLKHQIHGFWMNEEMKHNNK